MGKIWEIEGNNWFIRNQNALNCDKDFILYLMELYKIEPKKVIEFGCSNGYRLNEIYNRYKSNCLGVDISVKAITDGLMKFTNISLQNGDIANYYIDEKFDLAIINYVLHWIERQDLLNVVRNIDKSISKGGLLIIGDFGTTNFVVADYKHCEGIKTYKQDYAKLFIDTGIYSEVAKIRYNHDTHEITTDFDTLNMGTINLLRKEV